MNLEAYYPIMFIVLVAAAVTLLVEAAYYFVSGSIDRKMGRNRRVRAMDKGASTEQVLIQLKRERGIDPNMKWQVVGSLKSLIIQSGLRLTTTKFMVITFGLVLAVFVLCAYVIKVNQLISVGVSLILGLSIPYMVLRIVKARRIAKFEEQLPDALDVIVRSLRSGHPVPVALSLVGRELADPIGMEFGIAVDEMTYGLNVEEALSNLQQRSGSREVSLLLTAISLQASTGGNLSEILSNLSKLIRDRFQLRRKVRSLSAEGRISAYGMTILPVALGFYINSVNPRYYGDVWDEPIFLPVMIGVGLWSLLGVAIMFKMINFRY